MNSTTVAESSIHGPDHWARVERNGLYISRFNDANQIVVQLFALFHDCMRINDETDDNHGKRGAEFAGQLRSSFIDLDDESFSLFDVACSNHTDELYHDDITIATCWDADRLDIGRIGTIPDPNYLNTNIAQQIARTGKFHYLDQVSLRVIQ